MNNATMTPVNRTGFCRAIIYGIKVLSDVAYDYECAFHFSAEFGDVAMMRKKDGNIVLAILINRVPVAIFDYTNDGFDKYWSKRGEGQYSFWSKLEIYDYAMGLAKLAGKEVAK